MAKQFY